MTENYAFNVPVSMCAIAVETIHVKSRPVKESRNMLWNLNSILCSIVLSFVAPPVKVDRAISLDAGGLHRIDVDAPDHDQLLRVEICSPEPVQSFILLEEHADEVEKALLAQREPKKNQVLKSQQATKGATLVVIIPAKKGFTLILGLPRKSTEVKVKMMW
jgi:hypothetical protein